MASSMDTNGTTRYLLVFLWIFSPLASAVEEGHNLVEVGIASVGLMVCFLVVAALCIKRKRSSQLKLTSMPYTEPYLEISIADLGTNEYAVPYLPDVKNDTSCKQTSPHAKMDVLSETCDLHRVVKPQTTVPNSYCHVIPNKSQYDELHRYRQKPTKHREGYNVIELQKKTAF